jgi:putative phosphotransacetylase
MLDEKLKEKIISEIMAFQNGRFIPVTISNRHVHINAEARKLLLGDRPMTVKKYLGQPGQFAAQEVLKVIGPKGHFDSVRIVGPERSQCQVELSVSDCFHLGVEAVIRDSGKHEGTPGIYLVGPCGFMKIDRGVIVAQRHIHMTPEEANEFKVKDMQLVRIRFDSGARCGILGGVIVRVSKNSALECHLDMEEANALGICNNDKVFMELGGI